MAKATGTQSGGPGAGRAKGRERLSDVQTRSREVDRLGLGGDFFSRDSVEGEQFAHYRQQYEDHGDRDALVQLQYASRVLKNRAYKGLEAHTAVRLARIEDAIRAKPVEHAGAVGVQVIGGQTVRAYASRTDNDPGKVRLPTMNGVTNPVFTHNHPGGGSFSAADLMCVASGNSTASGRYELRAIAAPGGREGSRPVTYRATVANRAKMAKMERLTKEQLTEQIAAATRKSFARALKAGKVEMTDWDRPKGWDNYHAALTSVAARYGIKVTRTFN